MLETWLSKERLLLNSTPRLLTDDEESTEQQSSVRQCSSLLLVGVLGPIINTSVLREISLLPSRFEFKGLGLEGIQQLRNELRRI